MLPIPSCKHAIDPRIPTNYSHTITDIILNKFAALRYGETMADDIETISVDADLQARLATMAKKAGLSVNELALGILRAHADEQERLMAEHAEDEDRWQRYLAAGHAVSYQAVRSKLHRLAAEAAAKANAE